MHPMATPSIAGPGSVNAAAPGVAAAPEPSRPQNCDPSWSVCANYQQRMQPGIGAEEHCLAGSGDAAATRQTPSSSWLAGPAGVACNRQTGAAATPAGGPSPPGQCLSGSSLMEKSGGSDGYIRQSGKGSNEKCNAGVPEGCTRSSAERDRADAAAASASAQGMRQERHPMQPPSFELTQKLASDLDSYGTANRVSDGQNTNGRNAGQAARYCTAPLVGAAKLQTSCQSSGVQASPEASISVSTISLNPADRVLQTVDGWSRDDTLCQGRLILSGPVQSPLPSSGPMHTPSPSVSNLATAAATAAALQTAPFGSAQPRAQATSLPTTSLPMRPTSCDGRTAGRQATVPLSAGESLDGPLRFSQPPPLSPCTTMDVDGQRSNSIPATLVIGDGSDPGGDSVHQRSPLTAPGVPRSPTPLPDSLPATQVNRTGSSVIHTLKT